LSSGGFGASGAALPSAPAVSGSFSFVAQDEAAAAQADEPGLDRIRAMFDALYAELEEQLRSLSQEVPKLVQNSGVS
jgi:hypothetical protein